MAKQTKAERKRKAAEARQQEQAKQAEAKAEANGRQQASINTANNPTGETETDRSQNRRITFSIVLSILSFVVSVLTYLTTQRQTDLNQLAQDRENGKIRAKFELVDEPQVDPKMKAFFMRQKDGFKEDVFRMDTVGDMITWGPTLTIKNTGTEVIDGIRLEAKYVQGQAYGKDVVQILPPPRMTNDHTTFEILNFGKIEPGQTATVYVVGLLADQMDQLDPEYFADKDHEGWFGIRILCKIAGGPSYDQMASDKPKVFNFHWRPSGFKKDSKRFRDLVKTKPSARVNQ
jgi:archaellum component FlaG (FlaF/FlaG flagellin family)